MSFRTQKKLSFLGSLILLFTGLVTGCGNVVSPSLPEGAATYFSSSGKESAAATNASTYASSLPPVTLTQYVAGSEQPDLATVIAAVNSMLQPKINATVNLNILDWGTYDQRMNVMIAAAEPFDLCFTAPWINNFYDKVNKNAYLPLDALLAKYAPISSNAVPQAYWEAAKVRGEIYGFLNYQIFARTDSLYIRNDVATDLGFDPSTIKTLEDVTPFLNAVSKNKPDMLPINGGLMAYYQSYHIEPVVSEMLPGAIYMDDKNARVFNQFTSPEYLQLFLLLRDWYQQGYFPKDIATLDTNILRRAGKFAVETGGTYKPGGVAELASMMNLDADIFTEVLLSETYASTSSTAASMHAISRTSQNPERAMMYLELVNTDKELYNTLCFGIEDTHYTLDTDGYVESVANSGWNPATDWMFGNQFNALYRKGNEKGNWEKTIQLNEDAAVSPILGFVFDPTSVRSEIAQCQAVTAEYLSLFSFGSADLDRTLPEFQERLRNAGSERIVAEMQRQLDAWLR